MNLFTLILLIRHLFLRNFFKTKLDEENVLVIGAGPSGIDLVMMLTNVAKHVSLSRKHSSNATENESEKQKNALPNVILKGRVKRFTPNGAEFTDGTYQNFSSIIYATGE